MSPSERQRLIDSWRLTLASLEECLLWLDLARRGLAIVDVEKRLRLYLKTLREVSLAELVLAPGEKQKEGNLL